MALWFPAGAPFCGARRALKAGCRLQLTDCLAIAVEMGGERADRRELKEIEKCNLAAQCFLQLGMRFGHRERVRAEIEEVVVNPTDGNAQRLLPGARDNALHFVGGFGGAARPRRKRGSAEAA